ncbi:MAG: RluA family pseudouridine synthase [Chitinophagaceae bacterium]|nr:RluA family pseudouridine synthase [Bacteroidota bacterium]MCC6257418.1 RluA family pseudouridine synthase [Chitinophagaceae bacterium]
MGKNNIQIIFENENLVAVNKPPGLLTIPDRKGEFSLKDYLLGKYGEVYTVHRLDKETSGLVVFAKTISAHKFLSRLFENRQIQKYYVGLVKGTPNPQKGEIDAPVSEHPANKGEMCIHRMGKQSLTSYEVLDATPHYSLVLFQLHTGRTHQIRVHCKHIGHPLACDPLYGDGRPVFLSSVKRNYKLSKTEEEKPVVNRVALHAFRLKFIDESGNLISLEAPIPKEFTALMNQLHKI